MHLSSERSKRPWSAIDLKVSWFSPLFVGFLALLHQLFRNYSMIFWFFSVQVFSPFSESVFSIFGIHYFSALQWSGNLCFVDFGIAVSRILELVLCLFSIYTESSARGTWNRRSGNLGKWRTGIIRFFRIHKSDISEFRTERIYIFSESSFSRFRNRFWKSPLF